MKAHDPMSVEVVINLPYPAVVARAAELVGEAIGNPPLSLRLNAAAETLAATRTVAALLLAELEAFNGACPACAASDTARAVACASELGALEGRLQILHDQARSALSFRLARSTAA